MRSDGPNRRAFLASVGGVGALALAGGARGAGSTASGANVDARAQSCTPGHTEGDPACTQIRHDANALTRFDATDTDLVTTFAFPCGWTTTTTTDDDRVQANTTRSDIGEEGAYVDVQVRNYTDPVEPGYLDSEREEGDYDDVEYEYDGQTRTGLVSSVDTAQFGTTAHAVVPDGGDAIHVELVSTLHGGDCASPRPDYQLVRDILASLEPNGVPPGVAIADQQVSSEVQTQAVTVDSVALTTGGYVAIHDTPLQSDLSATVVGVSNYLSAGTHGNVRVALDQQITGSQDVVATIHRDTDGDNAYDFGTGDDGPYETPGGDPVSDRATVSAVESTPVPEDGHSPTPTLEPLGEETHPPTPTLEPIETTDGDEATEGEGSGFGVVAALAGVGGVGSIRWLRERGG